MDSPDEAFKEEQNYINGALKSSKNKNYKLIPTGECYYCTEEIEGEKLFCDHNCAINYDKIIKHKFRNI